MWSLASTGNELHGTKGRRHLYIAHFSPKKRSKLLLIKTKLKLMPLLRFDEEVAANAKLHASKKGYLHKADVKFKKLSLRWCCVRYNVLFVFESESCPKPLYSIFLEGAVCKPLEHVGLQQRGVTGAFYIDFKEGQQDGKKYLFCACGNQERDEWIESISCANLTRLARDLENMKLKCALLENQVANCEREVELLRQGNQTARAEVSQLRANLGIPLITKSPRESRQSSKLPTPTEPYPNDSELQIRKLQGYIRSWLIHRKWHKIVAEYLLSEDAQKMRDRYQILWRFVAAEEDYVSQLNILHEEYQQQCEIAAYSRRPVVTLEQCHTIFRNSEQLLVFHQLFLRGLHSRLEKWPVVTFGGVLSLFLPMTTIYHQFVGNHSHAMEMIQLLCGDQAFKPFLDSIQTKKTTQGLSLEGLLTAPLKKITSYIEDLKELKAHTPSEHVDYVSLQETINELEIIQKTVTDDVCISENVRQVLRVEQKIEGGCDVLLDKEQSLIREGVLTRMREGEKPSKYKAQTMYCFLFSKHLLVTTRIKKTSGDMYRLCKDRGILPLSKCSVGEHTCTDSPELSYVGLRVDYSHGEEMDRLIFAAGSTSDKAQWLVDLSQCIENEKQNRVLQRLNLGIPVEVSSKFIRYSTLKSGREQLVNCGTLDSLLQRLVRANYFNLDFLTTMLMTFPLFTNAHVILDFIVTNLMENLNQREKHRPIIRPEEAVKNARTLPASVSSMYNRGLSQSRHDMCLSAPVAYAGRRGSDVGPGAVDTNSAMGILFALKQWITKHFYSFQEDKELYAKLDKLLLDLSVCQSLSQSEQIAISELSSLYRMQKLQRAESCVIIDLMKADAVSPLKPHEAVLLWDPREVAEQLCIIESTLFCRVEAGEILRHLTTKKPADKKAVAPNLICIFEHFNRMSLFFMWSIVQQKSDSDRIKVLETLIQMANCCLELNNFSSYMQLVSALQHSSVNKFKNAWEYISKPLKQQYKMLTDLATTTGRFRQLREATSRAEPPLVPYLGIALNELVGIFEALPTLIEGNLINFSKMRKCSRTISGLLKYQKETYEFNINEEVCQILLCAPVEGDEDDLYAYVAKVEEK